MCGGMAQALEGLAADDIELRPACDLGPEILELLRQQLTQSQSSRGQFDEDVARMRAENERLRADAQAKINQLQERIKELNQKLVAVQGAPPRR